VTDAGLDVFELKSASWDLVFEADDGPPGPTRDVRAIFDMNDDGTPEIIEHFGEPPDGRGFEIVLQRRSSGDWEEIADNEDHGP
jgi:hypothetical protein